MRKLSVSVDCLATYTSEIEVPDGLTLEEAIEYAREHMNEINVTDLEWIHDNEICDDCCKWADGNYAKDS